MRHARSSQVPHDGREGRPNETSLEGHGTTEEIRQALDELVSAFLLLFTFTSPLFPFQLSTCFCKNGEVD